MLKPQYISAVNIIEVSSTTIKEPNTGEPLNSASDELMKLDYNTEKHTDFPMIAIAPLMINEQHGIHLLESSSHLSSSMPVLNDMKVHVLIMADLLHSVSASQPQLAEVTLAEQSPITN